MARAGAPKARNTTQRRQQQAARTRREAQADEQRRRLRRRRWLLVGGAGALVVLVALVVDASRLYSGIGRSKADPPGSGGGGQTFLLLGNDSREGVATIDGLQDFTNPADVKTSGADIIMVLRVPDVGEPLLVSIPRDLIVPFPAEGPNRITLALAHGLPYAVQTVCSALGIGVDHVVLFGFDGFVQVVDELGGFDVDLPYPLRDQQSGLDIERAGVSHLDGAQTLAYVRSRHPEVQYQGTWYGIPDASDTRLTHSKQVLSQMSTKAKASLRNPMHARSVVATVAAAVTADEGMGVGDFRNMFNALNATGGIGSSKELPVLKHHDELGTSEIDASTLPVLDAFGAGKNPACPRPLPPKTPAFENQPQPAPEVPAPSTTALAPTSAPAPEAPGAEGDREGE